jgi:hypothetical protein
MSCNKSTASVGETLNLSAVPGGGPIGISYTIKFKKQVGSGSSVVLNTQTSTGQEVSYSYQVTSGDNNSTVQFWAEGSYTCSSDGTTKTGTSSRCNVTVGTGGGGGTSSELMNAVYVLLIAIVLIAIVIYFG